MEQTATSKGNTLKTLEDYLYPLKKTSRFHAMLEEITDTLKFHETYNSDKIHNLYMGMELGSITGALINELVRRGHLTYIQHVPSERTDKSHYRKIGLYKVVKRT